MTEEKSPLEQALNLFVYAPVGLAALAREHLPEWIAKGRAQVTGQAALARMMGEYAINEAQREAEKALRQASSTLSNLTASPPRPGPSSAASPPAPPAPSAPAPSASSPAPMPATPAPPEPPSAPASPPPPVDALAIPGYDALSASQVVQRLAGLAGDELEAVRAYESATRGRKTILHRVDQLQNGSS